MYCIAHKKMATAQMCGAVQVLYKQFEKCAKIPEMLHCIALYRPPILQFLIFCPLSGKHVWNFQSKNPNGLGGGN